MAGVDELAERLLAAEHGVHLHEVAGVVPVVRRGQEHGGEVHAVHAQGLDMVQAVGLALPGVSDGLHMDHAWLPSTGVFFAK